MASGCKYFILNRASDWKDKSIIKNLEFNNDVLVSKNENGENGVYISSSFDSLQSETVWSRMRINMHLPSGAFFKLRVYASDSPKITIPNPKGSGSKCINLNEYIADKSIGTSRKIDVFDYIGAKTYENPTDILLYDVKGRYFWVCFEIINYENEQVQIEEIKIEFPQVSFVDYLPEIYRANGKSDSFLARFLGIFQSMYVDMEDKIDYTPSNYDTRRTSRDFLEWIADWFSVKDASIWGEQKLRRLIEEAVKIYKMKGTKRAVAKIVREYSGVEPIIVEQFDVKENMYYDKQRKVVENLFGDNGYIFTVMLPESHIKDSESYVELLKVINSVKPVDSICNLVILGNRINLDHHCYIGINSVITTNEKLILNRRRAQTNNLVIVNSNT